MKKDKKKELPILPDQTKKITAPDDLRINLAIGTITLFISILLLYIVNNVIYNNYHPDTAAILDKVLPLSLFTKDFFLPEPVERMQFQLSIILTPIFIFIVFNIINRAKTSLYNNPPLALGINVAGIIAFVVYTSMIFQQNLLYVYADSQIQTTSYFFSNNLVGKFTFIIGAAFYLIVAYCLFLYEKRSASKIINITIKAFSYIVLSAIIIDIILYDVFHLSAQEWGRYMETNAVFYSITQVVAGKSLLVNVNAQYGLFGWILSPLFRLIGLSVSNFMMTMAMLNGISFLLIYLSIKKIIKRDIFSLIVFMALVFWQFWQTRIPFESTPRYYYQYAPIRLLFPAIAFFLITIYHTGTLNTKRIILPLLALTASFAILWNPDTGIVVYGATLISMLFSAFDDSLKNSIKKGLIYLGWWAGTLFFVIALFLLSTKIKSGQWPDFKSFSQYQSVFYISGYFMLPMSAIHFWNLPVLMYLVAGIYCVFYFRKQNQDDAPVLAFLFILGFGLFVYFQGRSYDLNLDAVMYPSIIIAGIFCNKLFSEITLHKPRLHESVFLFCVPFLFLADGAFSMLYYMPSIHSFSYDNAFTDNTEKENLLKQRMDFVTNNIPRKDTVLIFAKDFESYYYAAGEYYCPLNLASSTELFFKSELYTILDLIKTTKYPILYDANHPSPNADTIVKTLAKYTTIQKELEPDHSFILLKPNKIPIPAKLSPDAATIYYNGLGDFSKYINPTSKLNLPENFTIEMYVRLDTTKLVPGNLMFSNVSKTMATSGVVMVQNGNDRTQYMFIYGNGNAWCNGAVCKLSCATENHIVIKVQKNIINVYNNNSLCGTANTNSILKNSDGAFFINPGFAGTVHELKISNQ